MEKLDLIEFMKGKEIASFMQSREDVDYLWPGFTLLNMPEIKKYESDIKFFLVGLVDKCVILEESLIISLWKIIFNLIQ